MPRVNVGIPVYRGEAFVAEALESLRTQTFADFSATISVDGDDAASAAICRRFESDPRIRVIVQNDRLGFARNLNWLEAQCTSEFFCYLGQDDHLAPDYLARLVGEADLHPEALVAYTSVRWFGVAERTINEKEIVGTPLDRVVAQIKAWNWTALRGLRRRGRMAGVPPLLTDSPDNIFEDVIWFAEVLRAGTARHVVEPLYFKRLHADSHSAGQGRWPAERARRGWLQAHAQLLDAALPAATTLVDRQRVTDAILRSLITAHSKSRWFFDPRKLTPPERGALIAEFQARTAGRSH